MINKDTKVIIVKPDDVDLKSIQHEVNSLYCYWIEKLFSESDLDVSLKIQLLDEFINDLKISK